MLELRLEPRVEVTTKQKLEQRHAIQLRLNENYIELVNAIHGNRYNPHAVCPKCGHKLDPVEILKGFRLDPNDITTKCPKCKTRFEPRLVNFNTLGRVEMRFYCPAQTLARLPGLERLRPEELQRQESAIYHSAMYHFGCLKKAFERANISYPFDQKSDWKAKVKPFLGQVPDTIIAKVAGVSASSVRRLRQSLRISRYNKYE